MLRVVVVAGEVVFKVVDDLVVGVEFIITESETVFSIRNILLIIVITLFFFSILNIDILNNLCS